MKEKLRFPSSPTRCPFCRDTCVATDENVVCHECLARHHVDCWDEHQACGNCSNTTRMEPIRANPAERPQRVISPMEPPDRDKVASRAIAVGGALGTTAIAIPLMGPVGDVWMTLAVCFMIAALTLISIGYWRLKRRLLGAKTGRPDAPVDQKPDEALK